MDSVTVVYSPIYHDHVCVAIEKLCFDPAIRQHKCGLCSMGARNRDQTGLFDDQ